MNLTENEFAMIENCQTAQDWSAACISIKKRCNGQYPVDWWPKVIQSGLADRVMERWGTSTSLSVMDGDGNVVAETGPATGNN